MLNLIIFAKPLCHVHACLRAQWLQLCLTLSGSMDHRLPGSSVHGILHTRILEWLPCPPPGDLPTQWSNWHLFCLLNWQVGSLPLAPPGKHLCHAKKHIDRCWGWGHGHLFRPLLCLIQEVNKQKRPCWHGVIFQWVNIQICDVISGSNKGYKEK